MTHTIPVDPAQFELLNSGKKSFYGCKDDRPFNEGDNIIFQEQDKEKYTGKECKCTIAHISTQGAKSNHVILGIKESVY